MHKSIRIVTVGPDHEPLWVRLYVYAFAEGWAAILADGMPPPRLSSLPGMVFVGKTPGEMHRPAVGYLGAGVSVIPIIPNDRQVYRVSAEKRLPLKTGGAGDGYRTLAKYHAVSYQSARCRVERSSG